MVGFMVMVAVFLLEGNVEKHFGKWPKSSQQMTRQLKNNDDGHDAAPPDRTSVDRDELDHNRGPGGRSGTSSAGD